MASFEGLSFHVVNGSAAMRGRAFRLVALALRGGLQERFDEPLGVERIDPQFHRLRHRGSNDRPG
jgi:hypothetical protein